MFKLKQKLENIYDLLISFNNNERKHTKATEELMRSYEKSNIELTKELEKERGSNLTLGAIVNGQELEIQRLTKIIEDDRKFKEDIKEYLKTVDDILQYSQERVLRRKKPTKVDLMTEKMYKVPDEVKAKLRWQLHMRFWNMIQNGYFGKI